MHTHVDKTHENKPQAASTFSKEQEGDTFPIQYVDNRPEAVKQGKLQDMANNSTQARQTNQLQAMANVTQRKLYTLGEMEDEPNLVSLKALEGKIDGYGELSPYETGKLAEFEKDNEEHIFALNEENKVDKREAQSVINPWPVAEEAHPITKDNLAAQIISIKQRLVQNPEGDPIEWLSFEEIRGISIEAMKLIPGIFKTNKEATEKARSAYGNLIQQLMKLYKGRVSLKNVTFLKEWALTTGYLKMGIPVWESNEKSTLQTREDLGPHKMRASSLAFREDTASKILSDKPPGFYAFVVPLSFPFNKKIMIGPEPNIETTHSPTRSEGHSALSTKDSRKKVSQKITLVKGVLFAGSVTIGEGGQVISWNNDSGHYKISRKSDAERGDDTGVITGEALEDMGFPFPMSKYHDIH